MARINARNFCHLIYRKAVFAAVLLALASVLVSPPAQAVKYADILMEEASGKILHEENSDEQRYPASLTKMMTLYLTFDALKSGKLTLKQRLKTSRRAAAQAPSKLGLRPGEVIRVEDAILALTTKSANDVSVALAEAIAGSEQAFATRMNRKARQLGMKKTHFQNASGLPNFKQVTTAQDMATLSRALIRNHKKYYPYFSKSSFTYRGVLHRNHNSLLGHSGIDGLKTGYIEASGFNLAASAVREGKRLICIVFGGPSKNWRDRRVVDLLNMGFGHKKGHSVMTAEANPPPLPEIKPEQQAVAPEKPPQEIDLATFWPTGGTDALETGETTVAPSGLPGISNTYTLTPEDMAITGLVQEAPEPMVNPRPAGWSIQVGAFSSPEASEQAIIQVIRILPSLAQDQAQPRVVAAPLSGNAIYRARLTQLSEQAAKDACHSLKSQGHPCMTISPGTSGAGG